MVKRVIYTSLICLAAAGLFWSYFHFVGNLAAERRQIARCCGVDVVITDSLSSTAVNASEISAVVGEISLGRSVDSIDTKAMEKVILRNGEVKGAEVFTSSYDRVEVRITQRRPVVHFISGAADYYCDASGYVFPAKHYIEMPVVTGAIPFIPADGFKGYPGNEAREKVKALAGLARYIESDRFLKRQIQQIDIDPNGDIVLYPSTGRHKIIFGSCDGISAKFSKLEAFYKSVVPAKGADAYSTVNLKYKNQIICR